MVSQSTDIDVYELLCLFEGDNPREAFKPTWFEADGETPKRPKGRLEFRSQVPDNLEAAFDICLGEGLIDQHLLTGPQLEELVRQAKTSKGKLACPANGLDALILLTDKGRAYLARHRYSDDQDPLDPDGIPAEFREGGEPDGEPLSTPYLTKSTDWLITSHELTVAFKKGILTDRRKVGSPYVYLYRELLVYRDQKTKKLDAKENRPNRKKPR